MAKNTVKISIITGSGVLVIALLIAIFIVQRSPFSNLETFPYSEYLEHPGDFLGNRYLLEAQIDSQLAWEEEVGRLLAVTTRESGKRIPVYVPADLETNLHTGQRYLIKVAVKEGGLIHAEALKKY
ncbi:MAG: hypothetical protein ACLFUF_00790 [Opitutales bacterium]